MRKMPRLTPLLASSEGEAAFTLEFDRDQERRARVRGHVQAALPLLCQRCLQQMLLQVDAKFQLSPVSGPREAEMLPAEYDPLMLDEQSLHMLDLIEDELILAIPPAPRHPLTECPATLGDRKTPEPVAQDEGEAKGPFAMLAKLKRDNNDE